MLGGFRLFGLVVSPYPGTGVPRSFLFLVILLYVNFRAQAVPPRVSADTVCRVGDTPSLSASRPPFCMCSLLLGWLCVGAGVVCALCACPVSAGADVFVAMVASSAFAAGAVPIGCARLGLLGTTQSALSALILCRPIGNRGLVPSIRTAWWGGIAGIVIVR